MYEGCYSQYVIDNLIIAVISVDPFCQFEGFFAQSGSLPKTQETPSEMVGRVLHH